MVTDSHSSRHGGLKPGGNTINDPHGIVSEVVDDLTRVPASAERAFKFVGIKAIPGVSAGKVVVCLPNAASISGYSWVVMASG